MGTVTPPGGTSPRAGVPTALSAFTDEPGMEFGMLLPILLKAGLRAKEGGIPSLRTDGAA